MSLSMQQGIISNIAAYPPIQIFGGLVNPSPKQKKAEKRITELCEELYAFNNPVLSDCKTAFFNLKITDNLIKSGTPVKDEYISEVVGTCLFHFKKVIPLLDELFKKDQQLTEYYKSWKTKYQDISKEALDYLFNYVEDKEKAKTIYLDTIKSLEEKESK